MLKKTLWLNTVASTILVGICCSGIAYAKFSGKVAFKTVFDAEKIIKKHSLAVLDTPPPVPILPLPKNEPISNGLPTYRQDRLGSPYSGANSSSRLRLSPLLNLPNSKVNTNINLDTTGKYYRVNENIGGLNYRTPTNISLQQYQRYKADSAARRYWLSKDLASGAVKSGGGTDRLIPLYKLPPLAAKLFGGDNIDIKPMGQVVLDLGGRWQSIANPQIPVEQQSNGGLFFDQQIRLSMAGSIGERLKLNINWDTKSTFQFENQFKIGYTIPQDDAGIIKELNVGNVSMQSSNSLITGGQNLMGIQTKLQFGKLWINATAANQRGSQETLILRGGGQQREFEIRADAYEFNKHFFLSEFFRNNYEKALRTIPMVTGGVVVTRVEVYVTNRVNNTQTLRNVASFLDLGNTKPYRTTNGAIVVNPIIPATSNDANSLYKTLESNAALRNIDNVNAILGGLQLEKGTDYEILRAARKLSPAEYTMHPTLGYISLQTPVRNDEIVAVSYEYTYNGQRFTVGELTEKYQNLGANDAIILKMLKPSTIRTDLPTWDLMMKNIYSLNSNQISKDNFQLRVIYRDDLTGLDNPNLQEGINTKDVPLLQIFGLDRLNQNNDPQPDGNFDFIAGTVNQNLGGNTQNSQQLGGGNNSGLGGNSGASQQQNLGGTPPITIAPEFGRIIFPVLEPFGKTLDDKFLPEIELQFRNKYVFKELYRLTQADAQLLSSKSKFFIKGSFQASTGAQIRLPGINIAPRSVQVQAGGTTLTEGGDYTVDYQSGVVNITNTNVLASGKEIKIQYERADLFNFQTRNLFGIDAQYLLSKNTRFTSTLMHLNERPVISRVNIGSEPTRNTLAGFGLQHREDDARFLTKMVDKLPFYSTKEKSSYTINSEIAALIPGTNQLISKDGGTSFIDDFEAAEIAYDLGRQPITWQLGATPQKILQAFPVNPATPRDYSAKRAKMSWYNVDFTAFGSTVGGAATPGNITLEDMKNHYVRPISRDEIIKPDKLQINLPEIVMNLAYYPNERGQYNFNTNLNSDGTLTNPRQNFGAITRGVTSDVDFDNINVQYMEFWLLDPFIKGDNGKIISRLPDGKTYTSNNTSGGKLYFNIGNISEDVIPDSRHGFENGLPTDSISIGKVKETAWGRVTEQQFLTNAFASENGARQNQDVGLDGVNDEQERIRYQAYLARMRQILPNDVYQKFEADPANDNFKYYLGGEADGLDYKVLDRYKYYNGTENNSPENAGTASYTTLPDNEDLNRDNSLNDIEGYYEYELDLRQGQIEKNPYIVDKVTKDINGDKVTWYQIRIPVREGTKVGAIDGFKSMRFMRMYMTDWEQPVVLRMARFQFVGTPWRPFTENMQYPGLNLPREPYNVNNFRVSSINIINNGNPTPGSNIVPYVLPPGFTRDIDLASNTQARLNEQSLKMCVDGLEDRDARAVYKNLILDMVNYKRLKMFLHAESETAKDGELTAFIRLGTDFKENFYEIEVPLKMTPATATTPEQIWIADNEIDVATQDLIDVKGRRNNSRLSLRVPYMETIGRFKITVIGNPDLSSVQTLMIGVRNPESADGQPKSVCIWANELRVAEFNNREGWATRTAFNAKLADLAIVNANFRYVSPFFGGIQDKISQRTRNHTLEYDVNMAIQLDKFYLNKLGINLPLYVGLERRLLTPYFNPLDPDTPLSTSLDSKDNPDDFASLVQEDMVARTITLANISKKRMNLQKKPKFWDIENWSLNLSYNERIMTNVRMAEYLQTNTKVGLGYMFTSQAKPIEPFKENKNLEGKYLKFIKEFNVNPMPNTISVRGDFERRFVKTQLRNGQLTTLGVLPLYEKAFNFNRSYQVAWSVTKNLRLDYNAFAMAVIDEPSGEINGDKANRYSTRSKQDSILYNLLNLGRIKNFTQKVGMTYKMPFDKFPAINWISSDIKYEGGYTWNAGTLGVADSLGNQMMNNQNVTLSGQFNMKELYDKNRLLKAIGQGNRGQGGQGGGTPQPMVSKYEGKRLRLQAREARLLKRKVILGEKFETVKADLQLDTVKIAEKKVKFDAKIAKKDEKIAKVREKLAELDEKEKNDANATQPPAQIMQTVLKGLMMVQKINFSYSETNNTEMPGVLTTPTGAFGMSSAFNTPGWGFVFGSQNPDVKERAAREGWLGKSSAQNNMFRQGTTQNLQLGAVVEPIKELQIMVSARRTNSANYSEIFSYNRTTDQFSSQTPNRMGQYSISYFSMLTAFSGDDAANKSGIFDEFIKNRRVVKGNLDNRNTQGKYDPNAQDVLIPSFLAAYSGRDINNVSSSAFPLIPLPNWKMNYNGLSNLAIFKPYFRSIQVEHGYSSEYSTGGYQSSLVFTDPSLLRLNIDLQDLPLAQLDQNSGKLTPLFIMNQVTITEAFAPLIGVRLKTTKNISINVRYNMNRGVALNLSNAQVTELKNSDITVDIGFTKANFKIPFKIRGGYKTLKNDLTFACALTVRDTKTAQRTIKELSGIEVQEATITQGNMNFQVRPTINYVLNQRASLQFYFDYMINSPYVSNSFRRSTTAFGIQFRIALQ